MAPTQVRQVNIMISSTRADLTQYRNEASQIIRKVAQEKEKQVQLIEVSMEKEAQSGDRESAVAVSRRWVLGADWVVLIVGWNYGTIADEDGYDGLSITEWEYEQAIKNNKKLFVFMAGEPGTANQYRWVEGEIHDLKDWYFKQTDTQKIKLEAFKQKLAGRHIEMFKNLQMFLERLEKTLKDTIDKELTNLQTSPPGKELILLIHVMMPHIRGGILKVTLINQCKKIHDYLHELLQYVIRPLREECLPKWTEEGTLSAEGVNTILRHVSTASEQVGSIRAMRDTLRLNDPDNSEDERYKNLVKLFNKRVDNVVYIFKSWKDNKESADFLMSLGSFTNSFDKFTVAVQVAFSIADQRMTKEESDLRDLYVVLLQGLRETQQKCNLAPCDDERLKEELKEVEENRRCMHNSLTNHHDWQKSHDMHHLLDSYRDTDRFDKELNFYRENNLSDTVLSLVKRELKKALDQQQGSTETTQKVCICFNQPDPCYCPTTCGLFVDRLVRLRDRLEVLRDYGGVAAFDRVQGPFDDSFYCVDKRTLVAVSRAWGRARDLEQWLDALCMQDKDD